MKILPFLKIALRDMKRVGAVMPSSKYAVRSIMRSLPSGFSSVLEYGPGDGILTRAILAKLPPSGRLLAIETNHDFVTCLNKIGDPRLTVLHGQAERAAEFARQEELSGFDLVVSGIPFSMLPSALRREMVAMTRDLLNPGGTFLVYQTSPLMVRYLKRDFRVKLRIEPLNVPPYFIMKAVRRDRPARQE